MMRLLSNLFSDRSKRAKWEAGLSWFRLRYTAVPTRAINLLSRPEACGRVALYYRPAGPVCQLYLGLPGRYSRLLERMAADFGFSLAPMSPEVIIPPTQPLTAISDLPWDRAFVAHIASEWAFVSRGAGAGPWLPRPPRGSGPASWQLPEEPPPGLTLELSGPDQPGQSSAAKPAPGGWLLGHTTAGQPLQWAGHVNLYGRQQAATAWLVEQAAAQIAHDPTNLVLIDGTGELVPRLKRKAAVTRRLGRGLTYLDLSGPALAGGFNPLAAVPGESGPETSGRWFRWFETMNSPPAIQPLLAEAAQAGVGDLAALEKWLKGAARQRQSDQRLQAATSLALTVRRLRADPGLAEWLSLPANPFATLPAGILIFGCQAADWARQQLLRAVILAAGQLEGVRLLLHGLPWPAADLAPGAQILLSNGPPLVESATLLVNCGPKAAQKLGTIFLNQDPLMVETLEILPPNRAILVNKGDIRLISGPKRGNWSNWLL